MTGAERQFVRRHGRVALRLDQLVVVSLYLFGNRKPILLEPALDSTRFRGDIEELQGEAADLWALARSRENPSWLAHRGQELGEWILHLKGADDRKVMIRRQRATEESIHRLMDREGLGVCRRCMYPTLSRLGSEHTCKGGKPLVLTESWCRLGVELFRQVPLSNQRTA